MKDSSMHDSMIAYIDSIKGVCTNVGGKTSGSGACHVLQRLLYCPVVLCPVVQYSVPSYQ